jgi:hypothetical protein
MVYVYLLLFVLLALGCHWTRLSLCCTKLRLYLISSYVTPCTVLSVLDSAVLCLQQRGVLLLVNGVLEKSAASAFRETGHV